MAFTSSSQIVLGAAPVGDTISNAEILTGTSGVTVVNNPGGLASVSLTSATNAAGLNSIASGSTLGLVCLTGTNTFNARSIVSAGTTIAVTQGAGTTGNINLEQSPYKTNQLLDVYEAGTGKQTGAAINFLPGNNVGVNVEAGPTIGGQSSVNVTINSVQDPTTGITAPWLSLTGRNGSTGNTIDISGSGTGPIQMGNNQLLGVQAISTSSATEAPASVPVSGWNLFGGTAGPAGAIGVPCFQVQEINDGATGWVPLVNASEEGPSGTGNAIPAGANQIMYSNGTGMFDICPASTTPNYVFQINSSGKPIWNAVPAGSSLFAFSALQEDDTPFNAVSSTAYITPYLDSGDPFIINLPAEAAKGDQIIVVNFNALDPDTVQETRVVPSASQSISWYADFVTGEGDTEGYASLSGLGESLTFLCLDNDSTQWTIIGSDGSRNALVTV